MGASLNIAFSASEVTPDQMADFKAIVRGKFGEREITHMYRLFHRAAPSGVMGPTEFKYYIESLDIFKRTEKREMYQHLFRGYDRDNDHTISFEEYLKFHLGIKFSSAELFDMIFLTYDANRDGYITKEEMTLVIVNSTRWVGVCDIENKQVRQAIDQTVDQFFSIADKDKDGRISRQDLLVATSKHPDILEKLKTLA